MANLPLAGDKDAVVARKNLGGNGFRFEYAKKSPLQSGLFRRPNFLKRIDYAVKRIK